MGYAFISYSTKNQKEADAMRDLFRKNGIDTWMAPYDIPVGSRYAQVVNQALKGCACLVLLLTDEAQNSTWVGKEVERAVSYRRTIVPLQLEAIKLNDEFELYISTDQIMAIPKIDEDRPEVQKMLQAVSVYTGTEGPAPYPQTSAAPSPAPQNDFTFQQAEMYFQFGKDYYDDRFCKEWKLKDESDFTKAVEWLTKAADLGHAQAMVYLGNCLYHVIGYIDYKKAVSWFRKAAELGLARGENNLGVCYLNGKGVEEDKAEAFRLFRKAAAKDYAMAQFNVGRCYYFGLGVEENWPEAVKWFEKAAEQGIVGAMPYLGDVYYYGKHGAPQNAEQAVNWYRKAAEQGNAYAQYKLGECFWFGTGVHEDDAEAWKWLESAAAQGVDGAQYYLQKMSLSPNDWYNLGLDHMVYPLQRDRDAAILWYRKAARHGSEKAKQRLKEMGERL